MEQKNIDYLRKFILFSSMNDKDLARIKELLIMKKYSPGEVIFMAGEKGDNVYFLKKGTVKVARTLRSGDEQILEILRSGDVFGEVVLFGIPEYPASAETACEVEVEYLSREKFRRFFHNNPEIGWGMMEVMARKLARSQHKIENLGLRNTKGRIARLLLDIVRDFGAENNASLELNQEELASFIGTTRETVSRTLSEFKKQDIISVSGNRFTILDREKLEEML